MPLGCSRLYFMYRRIKTLVSMLGGAGVEASMPAGGLANQLAGGWQHPLHPLQLPPQPASGWAAVWHWPQLAQPGFFFMYHNAAASSTPKTIRIIKVIRFMSVVSKRGHGRAGVCASAEGGIPYLQRWLAKRPFAPVVVWVNGKICLSRRPL